MGSPTVVPGFAIGLAVPLPRGASTFTRFRRITLAQRQPGHHPSAKIDQGMEGDRRPERLGDPHRQGKKPAYHPRAQDAVPALVKMRYCKDRKGERGGTPPTEPGGEHPDEVAAEQKLFADPAVSDTPLNQYSSVRVCGRTSATGPNCCRKFVLASALLATLTAAATW
jgi:hypothetical protein